MERRTLLFKCIRRPRLYMRSAQTRILTSFFLLIVLLLAPYSVVSARSVHQTMNVDIFPEGDFSQPSNWTVGSLTSFSEVPATYTDVMVADQRCTPGRSDNMIAANTKVKSGMVNINALASASGMPAMPYIQATAPI